MKRIDLPGSGTLYVRDAAADAVQQSVTKRHAVVVRECEARGWDIDNLGIEQILKIRALPEWKDAAP